MRDVLRHVSKTHDYGRVWISAHVSVCMPVRLCVQLCVHTHVQHASFRV